MVEVHQSRSVEHHRLLFALLRLVYHNLPEGSPYRSVDELLSAVKIATGYTSTIAGLDGAQYLVPRSIAFDKMDQAEFGAFFQDTVNVICETIIPGIDRPELFDEVLELVAGDARSRSPSGPDSVRQATREARQGPLPERASSST